MPGPAPLLLAYDLSLPAGERGIALLPRMANRHGLVAGATGTGKTVTLRVLAEAFSGIGVPVFLADVKGDLSGLALPGGDNPKVVERAAAVGVTPEWKGFPVVFWDLFGEKGHPVRATVSEMGPLLLSRMLGLNETQAGVLTIAFKVADDSGLLLLDLKDLRSMVQHVGDEAEKYRTAYGNISPASVGAIQRGLLALEEQGAAGFFGEPALNLADFIQTDGSGKGNINILAADRLMNSPKVYASFLLWLLSELFEALPEVGDPEKPKLVFFFDEAHLIFADIPPALQERIEQVVRLVRSKGVGVYFVTQNPLDLPDTVLGQLGNRVQHALRAYTPRDQKAVASAAETFRPNPKVDVAKAITELGTGEALVSFLDEKGAPRPVQRALVTAAVSRLTPLNDAERAQVMASSVVAGVYDKAVDRESAHEVLKARSEQAAAAAAEEKAQAAAAKAARTNPMSTGKIVGAVAQSAARAIGSQVGRQIVRGILGSLLGGRRR